jgi:hypothetical protein
MDIMNNNKPSRIVAALIMAILAAYVAHIIDAHDNHLGREAYLAKQAADYDQQVAHPASIVYYLTSGLICSCLYIGLYELLVFGIRKILDRINRINADDLNS